MNPTSDMMVSCISGCKESRWHGQILNVLVGNLLLFGHVSIQDQLFPFHSPPGKLFHHLDKSLCLQP